MSERHIEIMRGELAKIIYEAGRTDIEYMFGNSMTSLEQTKRGVNVTLRHGSPQTFDLVIGADGLHSITRRLAFGEEHQFLHFLGGYLAVFTVPNYLDLHQPGLRGRRSNSCDLSGSRDRPGAGHLAVLMAIRPAINEPYDVNPVAAPSGQLSGVERGRQADEARLEALADRWVSDNCGLTPSS